MNARHAGAIAMVCVLGRARAQDPQFTQFYATPTYLSPAFAGTGVQTRFALQSRDQWPSIPGAFIAALEHGFDEIDLAEALAATGFHLDQHEASALKSYSVTSYPPDSSVFAHSDDEIFSSLLTGIAKAKSEGAEAVLRHFRTERGSNNRQSAL